MLIRSASFLAATAALFHLACGSATAEPTEGTDGTKSEIEGATKDACREGDKQVCGSQVQSSSSSSGASTTTPLYQQCEKNEAGNLAWSKCPEPDSQGNGTPLVLVFDGAPVTYGARPAPFDLFGDGASRATDWPTARTPWLAIDRDGNGRVDDGSELFGSMTRLGSGLRARNGFEALAELDTNHDGVISAEDADFAKLVTWIDADGDRVSSLSELQPVSGSIVRIELAYRSEHRCTLSGNCEIERARFVYRDAAGNEKNGEVVDIHLRAR